MDKNAYRTTKVDSTRIFNSEIFRIGLTDYLLDIPFQYNRVFPYLIVNKRRIVGSTVYEAGRLFAAYMVGSGIASKKQMLRRLKSRSGRDYLCDQFEFARSWKKM